MTDVRENREMLASMSPDELRSSMRTLGYRTQNDLAQAIGVSRSAVSLWLRARSGAPGRHAPTHARERAAPDLLGA